MVRTKAMEPVFVSLLTHPLPTLPSTPLTAPIRPAVSSLKSLVRCMCTDDGIGRDGNTAVPYVCPASGGSTITFIYREHPGGEKTGVIAEGHKGPCSVYLKKVDDMFNDSAAGDGWFKIWEDGYDVKNDKWCTDTLIENNGLLSVKLPSGLPAGYYLARPELIALHAVAEDNDPQFYHGCAQIFIENGPEGPLEIPEEYSVSIPGYIQADHPGINFNIYYPTPLPEYPIPGPKVYIPKSEVTDTKKQLKEGAIPSDCVIKNANWCAKPIPSYSADVAKCWDGVDNCWAQSKTCWDSVPPSGYSNCDIWADYCESMGDKCDAGDYEGPPKFTAKEKFVALPGNIPAPYSNFNETKVDSGSPSPTQPAPTANETANEPTQSEPVTKTQTPETPEAPETNEDYEDDENDDEENVSPVPEQPLLKISENGSCGGTTGQTCKGSNFGDCCSKKGKCGRKTKHCTCGCQPGFGTCKQ